MGIGDLRYEIVVEGDESIAVDYGDLESTLIEHGFSVEPSFKEWNRGNGKIKIYGKNSKKVVGCIRQFNGRKNLILEIMGYLSDSLKDSDEYRDKLELNKYAKDYEPRPHKVKSLVKK